VDFRADGDGRLSFLEVNPLPGMHPEHSDLPILWSLGGRKYDALVREILGSAVARIGGPESASWTS
jgi:D-alanine-D-alanine ligase